MADDVRRISGPFLSVRRVFSRIVYGNLEAGLIHAARYGDSFAIEKWLDRGADLNDAGVTALQVAALNRHDNTVALLLSLGVDATKLPPGSRPRSEYSLTVPSERRRLSA